MNDDWYKISIRTGISSTIEGADFAEHVERLWRIVDGDYAIAADIQGGAIGDELTVAYQVPMRTSVLLQGLRNSKNFTWCDVYLLKSPDVVYEEYECAKNIENSHGAIRCIDDGFDIDIFVRKTEDKEELESFYASRIASVEIGPLAQFVYPY